MTEIQNNGAAALINDLIEKAVKGGASDIHFEPQDNFLKVRFRIDGLLQDELRISKSMIPSIVSRVKIMANLDIAEKRLPQDGRTYIKVDGVNIDLRISIVPVLHGEKVVMRLLNRKLAILELKDLGIADSEIDLYKSMITKPHGMILITGPTGGGKTTTLYATLNQINSEGTNIITIEDPIEYEIPGINQIQVNYKTGLTFAKGLRAILRQDPDIIMVGEIRDSETAKIAVQAALTGHLVLSTLHTNDSPSAITRLIDMGIEPFLAISPLIGIVAERLVRKLCPSCKGSGCNECHFRGYKGRIGIFEILKLNEEIKDLALKGATSSAIKGAAKGAGMKTLLMDGKSKIKEGITTEEEIMRVIYLD